MGYDEAVDRALVKALEGDELHQGALDQWADSGPFYEPPAYQRDSCEVSEVAGYVGETLLMVLADIEASR